MMLELLKKVLKPVAPSGLEEPVAAVIREEVAPYVDSIETDALGNLICVKNGTEANPEKSCCPRTWIISATSSRALRKRASCA